MSATIVCGVTDTSSGRDAALLAKALSDRLGLTLILVHAIDMPGDAGESVSARQHRQGAERTMADVARQLGLDAVQSRIGCGDPADLLAGVAAREAAAMIVIGSSERGLMARRLRSRPARRLAASGAVPVVVAPPQTRPRRSERLVAAG